MSVTIPEVSACAAVITNARATSDGGEVTRGRCSMKEEVEMLHDVTRCTTSMQVRSIDSNSINELATLLDSLMNGQKVI